MKFQQKIIGVIGGNSCSAEDAADAVEVGRLIAESGAVLVCGGGKGVMKAACQGAAAAGGVTIGILPGNHIDECNEFVQIPIATGMGVGRNVVIARTAQALIAVDGKYGTLSEIAYALQFEKPVFCLNSWNDVSGVIPVNSPKEAVEKALASL